MLLTMSTTHPHTNDFLSLLSHWHVHKAESPFLKRLSMRCLEVIALAAVMLFVPLTMHRVVQGLDEIYELLDRRAQSPYATVSWTSIALAAVMLLGWHVWLGRLSYITEKRPQGIRTLWDRVRSHNLIPFLLLTLGSHFIFQIVTRIKNPRPRITLNTVDMQEAIGQLYGFR